MQRIRTAGTRAITVFIGLLLFLGAAFASENEPPPGKPVLIGASISLKGKYAETSAMIYKGYRLWQHRINAAGGLLGRPVRIIFQDDGSDPARVGPIYEEFIEKDKVDLVLSPYGTPLTLAATEITEKHHYIMLTSGAAGSSIWDRGFRFVFGVYSMADRFFLGVLDLMARNGLKSVAIVYEKSPFCSDVSDGSKNWAERFGISSVVQLGFDPPGAAIPGIMNKVRQLAPDGLIVAAYPPDCYRMTSWMNHEGYRPRVLAMSIAPIFPDFLKKAGAVGEGVFTTSQWEPDERLPFPGTGSFVADFQAFYGDQPAYHAGTAYASCQILQRAAEAVGELDQEKMRDYISKLDTVTVIGRFKVDKAGRQIGHNNFTIQWQDGHKQIVYPTRMQTAPPRL